MTVSSSATVCVGEGLLDGQVVQFLLETYAAIVMEHFITHMLWLVLFLIKKIVTHQDCKEMLDHL